MLYFIQYDIAIFEMEIGITMCKSFYPSSSSKHPLILLMPRHLDNPVTPTCSRPSILVNLFFAILFISEESIQMFHFVQRGILFRKGIQKGIGGGSTNSLSR